MTSPTARSLAYCRKMGWPAGVVERWNPHARIRQDLWGVIDLIVLEGARAILFVQATSGPNHASRVAKVRSASILGPLSALGGIVEVWSWAHKGPRGKRKLWTLRREIVLPEREERVAQELAKAILSACIPGGAVPGAGEASGTPEPAAAPDGCEG